MAASFSVSVVIPVLNGADTIGDLLTALLHQSDPPIDHEIIVVDNGSSDKTCEVVRTFPVTLVSESQPGPSAARNRGLQIARGQVIAYLDADMLPTRQWLREIMRPFQDRSVMLVSGRTLSYQPQSLAQRYVAQIDLPRFEYNLFRRRFPFMAARNLAVRRESALAIGGWDERLLTAEDVDFCFRLKREFGAAVVFQAQAVAFHRDRESVDALRQQAFSYGQGWAQIYLKYPEVVRWQTRNSIQVLGLSLVRSLSSIGWGIGARLRPRWIERAALARVHQQYTASFWRGFFHVYRRPKIFHGG